MHVERAKHQGLGEGNTNHIHVGVVETVIDCQNEKQMGMQDDTVTIPECGIRTALMNLYCFNMSTESLGIIIL